MFDFPMHIKCRFFDVRFLGEDDFFFRKEKLGFFSHIDEASLRISKSKSEYWKSYKVWAGPPNLGPNHTWVSTASYGTKETNIWKIFFREELNTNFIFKFPPYNYD